MKFRIKVPGKFVFNNLYGASYYAIAKDGELSIVGIDAPEQIKKRYNFLFDDELASKYGLAGLSKEVANND
ncbi:hypothetical protein [Lactiplantibacillus paraxiangfangensis]|uniref:hypothetical protein n=1 Tax=Lactiplantibacillus paraxiangfangensis TaxID=3076224 RepID=UPI0030C6C383